MKLSDKQLDELANVWFTSDNEYWRTQPAHTEDRWRYRMTKVVEALEKMTKPHTDSQAEQDAARYRYLRDNSATYTSPKVPIQLIVQECADVHRTHGATGYRRGLDEAIDALMVSTK